jgi:hypothetical protein
MLIYTLGFLEVRHATISACILKSQYAATCCIILIRHVDKHVYINILIHVHIHIHIPIDFPANTTGYDSCAYANNDECDEPNICLPGTDTSDCTLQQSGVGTCDGVNETLSSADLNNHTAWDWGTCWTACLIKYPDTLVAINGPGMSF